MFLKMSKWVKNEQMDKNENMGKRNEQMSKMK